MKKQVLSLITTLCLLFALLPTTAFAEECDHVPGEILYTGPGEYTPDCGSIGVGHKECTKCHAVLERSIEVPPVGHQGGIATCKDRAVCDYCGRPYGELDKTNHIGETETRNTKEATCTEDGYTGDTYCKGCETKLQDGNPITKLGHIDADKNHVCDRENCKAKLSNHSGGTATCKDKAVCDYCGKPYGGLDSSNHHAGSTADCTHKAFCTVCGEEYGEVDSTNHTDEKEWSTKNETQHEQTWKCCGAVEVALENHEWKDGVCEECGYVCLHTGGTADCTHKAKCEVCGEEYGEVDSSIHAGGTHIKNDKAATCNEDGYTGDTYCKGCDTKLQDGNPITKLGHIDADKNHVCDRENCKATLSTCSGGTATCKDKAVCDYCGKPYGDFDSSTHAGGTHIKNDKAATCNEDGYTGDTYCKGCDTKLSSGKSVDKTGHDYESKVTKEATTTSTGTKTYTCKNCGHSYEEEIAKLPSQSTSPKTGDETPLAMTIAVTTLSAVALAVLLLLNKKRKVN